MPKLYWKGEVGEKEYHLLRLWDAPAAVLPAEDTVVTAQVQMEINVREARAAAIL